MHQGNLQVVGWGWYYLSTVLDDDSRYILAWTLRTSMQASDMTETLDLARAQAGVDRVRVVHRPRLLRDNGPCYISQELADYLGTHGLAHTRGAPSHPMTQGKIERDHRSMQNVVKLEKYCSPWELQRALARFVEDDNHQRSHESLQNVTPSRQVSRNAFTCSGSRVMCPTLPSFTSRLVVDHWKLLLNLIPYGGSM